MTSMIFLPKMHDLNLSVKKHYTNFKSVAFIKAKERLRNCASQKKTKETSQLNATYDSELGLTVIQDIIGTIGNI